MTDEHDQIDETPPAGLAPAPETEEAHPPPDVPTARLIVQNTVIFQPTTGQAQEVLSHREGTFVRMLWTARAQQPWKRTNVAVGREWAPLRLGWITDEDPHPPALVVVVNDEGHFRGIPTPEHKREVLARVVEVGVERDGKTCAFAEVPPYEHLSFRPVRGEEYFLRCRSGEAAVTLAAVPGDGRDGS